MTRKEMEALVGGYHGDPFRILGPHAAKDRNGWGSSRFSAAGRDGGSSRGRHGQYRCERRIPAASRRFSDRRTAPLPAGLRTSDGSASEFEDPYRFPTLTSDFDLHLYAEGTNYESYRSLGAHPAEIDGVAGVRFAVWAPNAEVVIPGRRFNQWDARRNPCGCAPTASGDFHSRTEDGRHLQVLREIASHGYQQLKMGSLCVHSRTPPKSRVHRGDLSKYEWKDAAWIVARIERHTHPTRSPSTKCTWSPGRAVRTTRC